MFLYASGCSLTFGAEIVSPDFELSATDPDLVARREALAWPGLLTKKLNFDGHHNAGICGASNVEITEETIRWVSRNWISPGKDPKELFVVVGWTSPTRHSFPYPERWATIQPEREPYTKYAGLNRLWTTYQDGFFHLEHDWYNHVQSALLMQEFLSRHGIPYLMFNSLKSPSRHIIDWTSRQPGFGAVISLTNAMDPNRYMGLYGEPGTSFMEWLLKRGYDNLAPRLHPREDGHEMWAEHLLEYISDKELI